MITGVIGVTFWTGDLERMYVFYNDVLRLPLHSRHEDFIAFELGDVRFNIGLHNEVSGASKDPFRFMPHLGVDDIHAEALRPGWNSSANRNRSPGAAGSPHSKTRTKMCCKCCSWSRRDISYRVIASRRSQGGRHDE